MKKEEIITMASNHTDLEDKDCVSMEKHDMVSMDNDGRKVNYQGHSFLRRGETELKIDKSGLQRYLPQCLQFAFADNEAEALYREYYLREKRRNTKSLIVVLVLVNFVILGMYFAMFSTYDLGQIIFLLLVLLLSVLFIVIRKVISLPDWIWLTIPYVAWVIQVGHLVCDMWLYSIPRMPSDSMAWALLYTYIVFVLFPLRLSVCLLLSLMMAFIHLLLSGVLPRPLDFTENQLIANVLLFVCANLLGTLSYFFAERRQRRAFLETRQSLEAKLVLEEESQEQERLLLSVLPKHVAAEIRQDLGAVVTGQFKKIYMSRHENVSILFADIVGFTAISSTCSAPELVKILNELFARFDKLSDKYHQLRIKILGDCYYCISGAPEERSDHAVLCVHMGLSMVEAIKSVREKTNSGVDMRVGVHTGAVLAGVLGQRQWQFDVYSRDVVLANKMESSGMPGRVHISHNTLKFLNGEFEVTAGEGPSREEALRAANLETYFIVRVIKPYPMGTLDERPKQNGRNSKEGERIRRSFEALLGCQDDVCQFPTAAEFEEDYKARLHQELLGRDKEGHLKNQVQPLTLFFKDSKLEEEFRKHKDSVSVVSMAGIPLVLLFSAFAYFLVISGSLTSIICLPLGLLLTTAIVFVCIIPIGLKSGPPLLIRICDFIQEKPILRIAITATTLTIWIAVHIVSSVYIEDWPVALNYSGSNNSVQLIYPMSHNFPQYLSYFCVLQFLAITVLSHVTHLIKLFFTIAIAFLQGCINNLVVKASLDSYDFRIYGPSNEDIPHCVTLTIIVIIVAAALIIINRQLEVTSRCLFLWQKEVEEQKEKVADMRVKNEALVYNILPPHVAKHFLGQRKNDEELYSKSYDAVGVLFAAMPNFSDFYTEDTVNNQGLECLRFLNEVISDYDALLEQPKFKDIIKIKTIGSTYMAASGLNSDEKYNLPGNYLTAVPMGRSMSDSTGNNTFVENELYRFLKPNAPIKEKWSHLAQLTEFALTLKDTLTYINRESFNNFVLRMGINQGPITAGVIGARKPHYDMWGNTVNVASRMESTGKAGCIQVVEETAFILQEFDYVFEQRGLVAVKGKGHLMTYYLLGRASELKKPEENANKQCVSMSTG